MSNTDQKGPPDKKFTAASLFAGMGGFCQAFKNAGFNVLWANENNAFANQTYRHKFPEIKLYSDSITNLSVIKDHLSPMHKPCIPSPTGLKKPMKSILRLLSRPGW